jgi:hypothetical protein
MRNFKLCGNWKNPLKNNLRIKILGFDFEYWEIVRT